MMRFKAAFFLVLLSSLAFSGEWSGRTGIVQIYPHSGNNVDGTIYLSFKNMINLDGCTHSGLVALKKSNNLSQEIFSLVLASYAIKSDVTYYVSGCDGHGYPELLHVRL